MGCVCVYYCRTVGWPLVWETNPGPSTKLFTHREIHIYMKVIIVFRLRTAKRATSSMSGFDKIQLATYWLATYILGAIRGGVAEICAIW
jgi:hypothetical protein